VTFLGKWYPLAPHSIPYFIYGIGSSTCEHVYIQD
jgi:hypothetical protein